MTIAPTARPTLPGRGQSSSARARGALQPPRGALQPLRVPPRTGGSRFKPAGGPTYMWLQPGHLRLQAGSTAGRRRKRTCATHGGCSRRSSCLSATAGSIARRCGSSSCAHRTRMMAVSPTSLAPRSNVVERTLARNYPCVRSPTAGAGQTPRARGASPCRVDAWGGWLRRRSGACSILPNSFTYLTTQAGQRARRLPHILRDRRPLAARHRRAAADRRRARDARLGHDAAAQPAAAAASGQGQSGRQLTSRKQL